MINPKYHPYGTTITGEDEKHRLLWQAILALSAPLILDGFYNSILAKYPPFYWAVEFLTWIVWPTYWIRQLFKNGISLDELGLSFRLTRRDAIRLAILTLLFLPFSLFQGGILDIVGKIVFPDNQFDQGFRYPSQMPDAGFLRFATGVYFALTAGLVEEIAFRSLPRLLSGDTRLSLLFYVFCSSALFSLIHWENGQRALMFSFFWGVTIACFFLFTRNLWPAIFVHFTYDFMVFYFKISFSSWVLHLL